MTAERGFRLGDCVLGWVKDEVGNRLKSLLVGSKKKSDLLVWNQN